MNAHITIDNYESYMLDYIEGSLTENDLLAVEAFLTAHPNIKDELNGLSDIIIPANEVRYQQKNNLKKSIFADNKYFNKACIASVEKTISVEEEKELLDFCNTNPDKKKNYTLFTATKLVPDLRIQFPNKEQLYKKAIIVYFRQSMQVAASVAAVLLLAWVINWQFASNPAGYPLYSSTKIFDQNINNTERNPLQPKLVVNNNATAPHVELSKKVTAKITSSAKEQYSKTIIAQDARFTLAKLDLKQTPIVQPTNIEFLSGYIAPLENPNTNYDSYEEPSSLLARVYKNLKGDKVVETHLPNTASNPTFLSFLTDVTQNKFQYAHTDNGKLENIAYRGRLLNFRLPLNSNNN